MSKNEIKSGALLSYVNLLLGNLIPFIYTPIMLRMLGQAEYGIYGIAQSVMGYLGLLNFGIGGSIVRYLSKYRAEEDYEGERRVFGLFVKIYCALGALILVAGMLWSNNLGFFGRSLSGEELGLLKTLVRLMTVNTAVFMPFNVFTSVIIAHERFVFSKTVSLLSSVLAPCMNLALLIMGYGSVGLVVSSMLLHFLTYALYTYFVFRTLNIKPSFKPCKEGLLDEILRFSLLIFLASIVDILFWTTDKLIIGWALGSVATAVYNVGATFNGYVTSLSTAISGLLMPKVTQMTVKNTPKEEFTNLFIKVGRVQFILISFIVSAFIVFGKQFISIWAGAEYAEAYYVALLVMIPVTIPLIQNTGINILYAMNKHKFRSVVYFVIAVLNVLLTLVLVETIGIVGAALATCIAYVLGNILAINWYYYKKIGIDIPKFWSNILRMCPVMICMIGVGLTASRFVAIGSWSVFIPWAALYTCVYCSLAYVFMMNEYEKGLIKGLFKRLKRG